MTWESQANATSTSMQTNRRERKKVYAAGSPSLHNNVFRWVADRLQRDVRGARRKPRRQSRDRTRDNPACRQHALHAELP